MTFDIREPRILNESDREIPTNMNINPTKDSVNIPNKFMIQTKRIFFLTLPQYKTQLRQNDESNSKHNRQIGILIYSVPIASTI